MLCYIALHCIVLCADIVCKQIYVYLIYCLFFYTPLFVNAGGSHVRVARIVGRRSLEGVRAPSPTAVQSRIKGIFKYCTTCADILVRPMMTVRVSRVASLSMKARSLRIQYIIVVSSYKDNALHWCS